MTVDNIENRRLRAYSEQVAIRIVNMRNRRGFSQKALAEKMGLHHSVVTYVETGRANLTLGLLLKFADFFDVKVSDLLSYSRKMIEGFALEYFDEPNFKKNGLKIKRLILGTGWIRMGKSSSFRAK